jgi:hypothetical protein
VRRLFYAVVAMLLILAATPVHAAEGPGYGGDAGGLNVTWKTTENKAAAPPPVPGDSNENAPADPNKVVFVPEGARLQVDGIGFRGLSEVEIQFGAQKAQPVRADTTGSVSADFLATTSDAPGTTVVAIGRGPSGAIRTLVGSVPPLPHGPNPMGIVPWLLIVPIVGLAILGTAGRRRPAEVNETEDAGLVFGEVPLGPPIEWLPMPAPASAAVDLPAPSAQGYPAPPYGAPITLLPPVAPAPATRPGWSATGTATARR